ncbi:MAG: hypothetical protein U1E53_02750 [Dongiaceae bacterium]
MTKRVVLHIGPPKTGTKSIQASLSANREALLDHGVYFPDTKPADAIGHPSLAWDIQEDLGRVAARWSDASLSWPTVLARAAEHRADTILLSSEAFVSGFVGGDFDGPAFAHMRAILGDLPVIVVFGLRDPCRLIPSAWQQMVRSCSGNGEEYLPLERAAPIVAARPWIRVAPYVAGALGALQPMTLRFFTVPPRHDYQTLLRRFGEAATLPAPVVNRICAQEPRIANEGLSALQAAIMLRINQCQRDADPESCRYPGNARRDVVQWRTLILEVLGEARRDAGAAPTLGPAAHEAATRIGEGIIEWIGTKQYFVAGDLADLQSAEPPSGEPPPIDRQAVDAKALRLLLQASRLAVTRQQSALAYLKEVEKARDWWHAQSDAWQSAAQR